jgi:hypothetical protein
VPNNHSKYHTSGVRILRGTPVKLKRDHGGSGVELPDSLAGVAFHHGTFHGQKRLHGPGSLV